MESTSCGGSILGILIPNPELSSKPRNRVTLLDCVKSGRVVISSGGSSVGKDLVHDGFIDPHLLHVNLFGDLTLIG